MQPVNGLNELREQGRMTWIDEEHGARGHYECLVE
jgi:hypothetical protein